MRTLLLLATFCLGLWTGACAESDTCTLPPVGTYQTDESYEHGLGPDGVIYAPWTVTIRADSTWAWSYSDAGPVGPFRCDDDQLMGVDNPQFPNEFLVSWDAGAAELTWDGKVYRPVVPTP